MLEKWIRFLVTTHLSLANSKICELNFTVELNCIREYETLENDESFQIWSVESVNKIALNCF